MLRHIYICTAWRWRLRLRDIHDSNVLLLEMTWLDNNNLWENLLELVVNSWIILPFIRFENRYICLSVLYHSLLYTDMYSVPTPERRIIEMSSNRFIYQKIRLISTIHIRLSWKMHRGFQITAKVSDTRVKCDELIFKRELYFFTMLI